MSGANVKYYLLIVWEVSTAKDLRKVYLHHVCFPLEFYWIAVVCNFSLIIKNENVIGINLIFGKQFLLKQGFYKHKINLN